MINDSNDQTMAALETGSIPFDKKLFCGGKLIERSKVSTIFIYIEFFMANIIFLVLRHHFYPSITTYAIMVSITKQAEHGGEVD